MMGKKIAGWNRGGPGEVLDMCFPEGKVEFNNFDLLTETIKKLSKNNNIPQNVFLTSDLMHSKTVSYYLDAIDRNS